VRVAAGVADLTAEEHLGLVVEDVDAHEAGAEVELHDVGVGAGLVGGFGRPVGARGGVGSFGAARLVFPDEGDHARGAHDVGRVGQVGAGRQRAAVRVRADHHHLGQAAQALADLGAEFRRPLGW
jgi:hypothetical protein